MNFKNKITFGLLFLYANILALGILGLFYIHHISAEANSILKDNFNSLEYSNSMLKALDEKDVKAFEENLNQQEKNITEKGEKEITQQLKISFKEKPNDEKKLRHYITQIIELNQKAIHKKSTNTQATAQSAYMWLGLIGGFLFIIALTFIVSYPSYVANPVKRIIGNMEEVNENKTNFISNVSHELKTPIASIKMSADLLKNQQIGNLNEEQYELVNHIKDDSERLLKITGELLDIGQIETGKIKLNIEKNDLQKIVQYAISATSIHAEQKNIQIHFLENEENTQIKADAEKTAWVLINLLNNAIRFSYNDSIIKIQLKKDKKKIFCSVQDFGKGIEEQYQNNIFKRYFQVPGSKGTGLGLAISKEFIEAQGGEIYLQQSNSSGSIFTFYLNV